MMDLLLNTPDFPALEAPLIDGDLAFRQHGAGHTPAPNWPTFITFAQRYLRTAGAVTTPEVALTFDDLPSHGPLPPGLTRVDIIRSIIAALRAAQAPRPYGFINAAKLKDDPDNQLVLQLWRDAGFPLGNHTLSHMDLNANSLESFERNVLENEPTLLFYMASEDWHWLRFPYLREGDTQDKHREVLAFLRRQGYRIAEVTLDFSDYAYNEPYARCLANNDSQAIDWLKKSYLRRAEEALAIGRKASDLVYGRQIKHVMLLHVGGFETVMLPSLLDLLKQHGFKLVTLQEAESDPAYAIDPDVVSPDGATLLQRMMQARHLPPIAVPENVFGRLHELCLE